MNKEKNFISAIIYVHNVEKRIEIFLKNIIEVLELNFKHSEIICINDNSQDESLEMIKKASALAKITTISVVNMSYFHGLELAMNAGMDLAIGDFVFEFDNVILDFNIKEIMKVYYRALQGYDIVSAIPKKKEKFTSKVFYTIFEYFTDLKYHMQTESFRILSRRAINRVGSMSKTVPYRKVLYIGSGLKTDKIEYMLSISTKNIVGKKEKRSRINTAVDSLLIFTNIGYKFSIGMTGLMMVIICIMIVYSITAFLVSNPIAGWTSTILFLSIIFGGLFGILTIIIKYLQLLLHLAFVRRRYTFESTEKLTKY